MKTLKNVLILRTIGDPRKKATLLKAQHFGDTIEIYEEEWVKGNDESQTHIATISVNLDDWNREDA